MQGAMGDAEVRAHQHWMCRD